jgi:sulfate adenylyltransferase subunit 1 (EFTu-like GTPase family)
MIYPENSALNIQLQGNTPLEGKLIVTHTEHFTSTKNIKVELYFCENTDMHVSEIVFSGFGQESALQSVDIHHKMREFEYEISENLKMFLENDWCLGTLNLSQEIALPKVASRKTFILINKASAKTLAFGKIIS